MPHFYVTYLGYTQGVSLGCCQTHWDEHMIMANIQWVTEGYCKQVVCTLSYAAIPLPLSNGGLKWWWWWWWCRLTQHSSDFLTALGNSVPQQENVLALNLVNNLAGGRKWEGMNSTFQRVMLLWIQLTLRLKIIQGLVVGDNRKLHL